MRQEKKKTNVVPRTSRLRYPRVTHEVVTDALPTDCASNQDGGGIVLTSPTKTEKGVRCCHGLVGLCAYKSCNRALAISSIGLESSSTFLDTQTAASS